MNTESSLDMSSANTATEEAERIHQGAGLQ